MPRKRLPQTSTRLPRSYYGANIPMRVIRQYTREVAERFRPDKIILFGSYAYGTPHADSDVDLLVVMPESCRQIRMPRRGTASALDSLA